MKLLAIDGNSMVNRAFYGIRALTNSAGIYTNAIFGFMNIYFKQLKESGADHIAVAFDLPAPTFRHQAVDTYKANRKGMPEELAMQMPYLKQILSLMGIPIVTCEGYEADDILGTLSAACARKGIACDIVTGDRDNLQLVNAYVSVRLIRTKEEICYTPDVFQAEYGFAPQSLIDLKALMGDTSDNYSGVKGIGEKTAMKLVQTWGTIENLYAHLGEAELTKGNRTKLENGKEDAERSKWLATIVTNAPLDTEIEHYLPQPMQREALHKLLMELELIKLMDKLSLHGVQDSDPQSDKCMIQDSSKLPDTPPAEAVLTAEIFEQLTELPAVLLDDSTEYEHLDLYAPEKHTLYTTQESELICTVLSRPHIAMGAKSSYRYLLARGIEPQSPTAMDIEIAAYLLDPTLSAYTIEQLAVRYCHLSTDRPAITIMPLLWQVLHKEIQAEDMEFLMQEELHLTLVLASMEHEGVGVQAQEIRNFGESLRAELSEIEQRIYDAAGHTFTIGSPKQLGVVLFDEMGLPHGKKGKNGYSTSAEVLERIQDEPIVADVLQYRQYTKLLSTYVDGLLKAVSDDGRIHTSYRQTETRTGRISSTEPNLQNIPVRTSLGRNMRRFFAAGEGCVLLDADYSQIELRLMANLSGDLPMQEAFLHGADIHTATAAQIFGLPAEMVTPSMRSAAKAINFGILYGMGAFSLSQDIHVSVKQAKNYIENYFSQFPGVRGFLDRTVEAARQRGYVTTYFGRRRPVPELNSSNKMQQAAGERIARNTPIQGTAADIIKFAMVRVYERLRQEVPSAKLILQIHDELIVEVPQIHALTAAKILGEQMQNVIHNVLPQEKWTEFPVPLTADVKMGSTWYEAKGE